MFLRETTIGGSFVRVETLSIFFATIEIVEPITMLAHLFLPVCHHLIGRQYVTCSVIGWKLFTLQDVEALPSVCTESWLPTQWVNRPKQCPTPPSYWIPLEPRVWLSSQCWPWHGWRDSHQDFSLSSDSRASSTSSIHGRIVSLLLLLQFLSLSYSNIVWKWQYWIQIWNYHCTYSVREWLLIYFFKINILLIRFAST